MFILSVPVINQVMERCGLMCRWRAAMTLDLSRLKERPCLRRGYQLLEWDSERLAEVAELDYEAYRSSLDSRLYWQYFASPQGCEQMWREAMAGKFGRFDPLRTLLLEYNGHLCGNVMASIRNPHEGFIGNLAVAPEHRGGTGAALLLSCLWRYRDAGFDRVSLAVTLDNRAAYHLYDRLGFVISHRFPLITRVGHTRG